MPSALPSFCVRDYQLNPTPAETLAFPLEAAPPKEKLACCPRLRL
jgi:hypothetical protein